MPSLQQKAYQKAYIEMISKKAKDIALKNPKALLFDPQGRVLIDVKLSEEEKILFKKGFGDNREPSAVTTVSLDCTDIPELTEIYKKQYGLSEEQLRQISGIKDSIIPLQQEFHFHLALAARTYTKADSAKFPEDTMAVVHQEAMKRVQPLIQHAFAEALKKATKNGIIDDVKLVEELDKARKKISEEAQSILMEEIVKATGQRLSKEEMKKMDIKHVAEATTASPNDLLHTNQSLGQATWISGSDVTAHHRGKGKDHVADRQIVSVALNTEQQVRPRLQIRTPSLDVKEEITEQDAVIDIKVKLDHLQEKYDMVNNIHKNPLGRQAFTYNLHTAINMNRLMDGDNKQSQGARVILQGAHDFNAAQMNKDPKVYCFVQNISVNGFGDNLGYGYRLFGNTLKKEATLMAEMAMLHNLVSENDSQKKEINAVFEKYEEYLKDPNRKPYFSQSAQGKAVISQISAIKDKWAKEKVTEVSTDPVDQAKAALKTMMANNLHFQHEYAKLFQSLSIFIEEASIAGCKSGNERAQAINGRVAVFDCEATKPNSAIFAAIQALATANGSAVEKQAASLKKQLDREYDKHLQAGVSLISDVDQGASAKVEVKASWYNIIGRLNTNNAEESSLKHLSQAKAGKMQAHKDLTKNMAEAWEDRPKSFGKFLNKTDLFLSVITFGIYAAYKYTKDYSAHQEKVKQTEARITGAIEEHDKVEKVFNSHRESDSAKRTVNPTKPLQSSAESHSLEQYPVVTLSDWRQSSHSVPEQLSAPTKKDVYVHMAQFKDALREIRERATQEETEVAIDKKEDTTEYRPQ